MALRFSRTTAIREERERKRLQRKERIIRQMSFGKKKKQGSKMNGFCLTQGYRFNALALHPRSPQTSLSMLPPLPSLPL